MTNNGTAATTYDLSVTGLPAGVTATFSQPSVTLQPGHSIGAGNNPVTLTLTESGTTLVAANFTVTADRRGGARDHPGHAGPAHAPHRVDPRRRRDHHPAVHHAGGKVAVSAQVQAVVNEPTQVMASYTVTDPTGNVLFTSTPVPVALT